MTTRVYILAKELGVKSSEIVKKCRQAGLEVQNHMTPISSEVAALLRLLFADRASENMNRTLIQKDASSLVQSFIARADVLRGMEHRPTKGTFKELFTSDLLQHFLTIQFGIGSGIIINHESKQSHQSDIVIYDKRIIPPFISGPGLGVYPVESVVGTIEMRTKLDGAGLMDAENAAKHLSEVVFTRSYEAIWPLCAVFGFEGGVEELSNKDNGKKWLTDNVHCLKLLCIAGKYSWGLVHRDEPSRYEWTPGYESFANCHDETKRFLALFLDNLRTLAEDRYRLLTQKHQDWFSGYIRG